MKNERISGMFEAGVVGGLHGAKDISILAWNEHNLFKGVYLKHLVRGEDTNGLLSCHLVKVNPGSILDTHTHNGTLEIHEVIEGEGMCLLADRAINYQPGTVTLIPADTLHKVVAGDKGLFLLTKFAPALV
ncbi:MAG TPA: cupin domain-containing protein [Syntrophomonadaceae bacterium]|nr:cupin domain-containing protein [Syntrophomonadaceae bacterium]